MGKKHRCYDKAYTGLFNSCINGSASPRQAIKAFCYECVGFIDAWKEVRNCTDPKCPLFRYRPYMNEGEKRGKSERQEAN